MLASGPTICAVFATPDGETEASVPKGNSVDVTTSLAELAERCEQASEPNTQLDRDIWMLAVATEEQRIVVNTGKRISMREARFRIDRMSDGARYTASLDAVMSLVPEGWSATVVRIPGHAAEAGVLEFQLRDDGRYWRVPSGADSGKCKATTPALALCAASLRARALYSEVRHG